MDESKVFKEFEPDKPEMETLEYAIMTALVIGALVLAVGVLAAAITGQLGGIAAIITGLG